MQYNDYTINYQLNDNTFYIKVINNIMLTVYETTIDSDNFKYKLSQLKNIFDNCLKTKDIILNFIVSYNKLTINTIYKTEFMDIDFDIILNQVEVSNVSTLDLNRKVFELEKELENVKLKIPLLENKLQYYEDMTPIIFTHNKQNNVHHSNTLVYYSDVTFYQESHIRVFTQELHTKITTFCNESKSKNISESNKEKYKRIQDSLAYHISSDMLLDDNTRTHYNIIVPPKKIVKVWMNDNNPPTILSEGVHKYTKFGHVVKVHLIWLGSIKYKDDIPDNFELANFKNFE